MPARRQLLRFASARLVLLAAVVALLFALPAAARAPLVSAQTTQCANGVLISIGTQNCSPTYQVNNGCPLGAATNSGICYSGNYSQCSDGSIVAYGTYCQTNGITSCPYGGSVLAGQPCPQPQYQTAGCTSVIPGQPACTGQGAVRYCASTSAAPQPVPCSGTTAGSSQYCVGAMASAYPQLCSTASAPASQQLTVCPGSGATVSSSSQCPQSCPNGQVIPAGQQCSAGTATTSTSPAQGTPVTLSQGWNLVGGPTGATLTGILGSVFTYQSGDSAYEVVDGSTQLKGGAGYWVYVSGTATLTLPTVAQGTASVALPAGKFVMIGNPGDKAASVTGADMVLAFNAATNSYSQTTSLQPGAGAWAMSNTGGQAAIASAQ